MGRRLPFLLAFCLGALAQDRHMLGVPITVDLSAIARAGIRTSNPRSTPRPKRLPAARALSTVPSARALDRAAAPHDTAPGAVFAGFQALLDVYEATPPDTGGAVGPADVVTMLNSQVAIQSRTGVMRPDFPIDLPQFWSGLGTFAKVFDPRVLYDASADRWIASAGVNPAAADSALLLATSATGDPGGIWNQFKIPVGPDGYWVDYPVLGLSRSWIVLTANLFAFPAAGAAPQTRLYAFDKATLYQTGTAAYSSFSDSQGPLTPAVDLDQQTDTLYFAQAFTGSGAGRIRVSLLRGPVGSESFLPGAAELPLPDPWAEAGSSLGDFAPQRGIWYKIDTGDSRLQNCVLRNAAVWCTHTVFLPAGSPTRAAIQWFQIDPSALSVVQLGRIDDPQGITFYAFPSIAVNRAGDVLIGYSRFTSNDYPGAAFSWRKAQDPAGAMRTPVLFKPGEAPYAGIGADEGSNRWGDVSGTVVDSADGLTFWTIQQYAATPTDHYLGRWGTWWASVPVSLEALNCSYSITPTSRQFDAAGGQASITVNTSAGCPWMAASNSGWMAITSGSPGNGSGTVTFSVSPNSSGLPLTGSVTIAGQTVAVTQGAGQ